MAAAVLVHGTPLDHRAWDPLIGELAGTHCVAHDLPWSRLACGRGAARVAALLAGAWGQC